jgi:nijmegen breakage syndrome protein 1
MVVDSTPAVESQSQGLFVSQDPPRMDLDREGSQVSDTQRGGRKRSTPPIDYDDSQDIMDDVAPAAQAFKKRKLAVESARRLRGESTPPPPVAKAKHIAKAKAKAVKEEIDVQEVLAKKQAEEAEKAAQAEELARAEREALQETLDGMDMDAIRNLAIVEEMPVTRKAPPPRTAAQADEGDRWDERWNGRKNFKKFRRRGADPNGPRVSRVIVPLEEVKKKDFGIGDEYWGFDGDADTSQRKKKKGKTKDTQETQAQSQARPAAQAKPRGRGAAARAAEILASEAEGEYALPEGEEDTRVAASSDVEIVEPPPKPAARSQRSGRLADKTNESQNLPRQRGNKRVAAATLSKPAPTKKAKPAPVEEASDDDSDDGLKFRFARRK